MAQIINNNVIIIGAGPAGLFAAYELTNLTNLRILIIEQGNDIHARYCNVYHGTGVCTQCNLCHVACGFGGAGLFSDGKLCLTSNVGGFWENNLDMRIGERIVDFVVATIMKFGSDGLYRTSSLSTIQDFTLRIRKIGLDYKYYPVLHLGSDNYQEITKRFRNFLISRGVKFQLKSRALDIIPDNDKIQVMISHGNETHMLSCKYLIVAPGKTGTKWLIGQAERLKLKGIPVSPYIGVRIEVQRDVALPLKEVSDDPKFYYYTTSGEKFKTHCFCDGGYVSTVMYDDITLIGGHSLKSIKGQNTNFAILMRMDLPPTLDPYQYCTLLIRHVNYIGNGKPLIQTLGRLKQNFPSSDEEIRLNSITPSLHAVTPTNLKQALPYALINGLVEFIHKLEFLAPGIAQDSTLIYAIAVEWWARKISVTDEMETQIRNLFLAGDGAGLSQGIVTASASGIIAAREIAKRQSN
jgi:uncharacterized FAD-dependent dehydrogenase